MENTIRFNEGLTRAIGDMQKEGAIEDDVFHHQSRGEGMSTIMPDAPAESNTVPEDETELTLSIDDEADTTIGDLSTISTIPADLTRLAYLRESPTKTPRPETWSPSKQLRTSIIFNTPGTVHRQSQSQSQSQRPLHLLAGSRLSNSSNEDEEATPRRSNSLNDSPTDLLNFTGQSNIFIPAPGSAPRTTRRSPSGRGAFPIRVNPSSTHRSQASVDRERSAGGPSPQKQQGYDRCMPATPADSRRPIHVPNGLGLDLLDIDLEPMATPRSIPSVTPRELETLRSELQSRISGLEATLSGKEAEVMALKRAITDAEVRVGKTSEELRIERAAKEELEHEKAELERRSREMEAVLRELKQNAFVEEREREKMRREFSESERKVEECEVKILELTASLGTLSGERMKSPAKVSAESGAPTTPGVHPDVDMAVKQATESVARELHVLYKGKHERKVADLKVSYEKRWVRQVEQLKSDLKSAQDEVSKLMTERDTTLSGVIPGMDQIQKDMDKAEEEKKRLLEQNEKSEAERRILVAQVAGLEEQIGMVRTEADDLRTALEQERIEKGELVAQVDLFLSMSAQEAEARAKSLPESPPSQKMDDGSSVGTGNSMSPSKMRNSLNGGSFRGRPRPISMLKAPAGGKFSGIPAPGSGTKGVAMNGGRGTYSGLGGRSGIMENIARMGAGRG
jgi:Fungal Transforming acidic coiled-coil (TACC) proteins